MSYYKCQCSIAMKCFLCIKQNWAVKFVEVYDYNTGTWHKAGCPGDEEKMVVLTEEDAILEMI
jgi:hypothetical protein